MLPLMVTVPLSSVFVISICGGSVQGFCGQSSKNMKGTESKVTIFLVTMQLYIHLLDLPMYVDAITVFSLSYHTMTCGFSPSTVPSRLNLFGA